MAIFPRRRVPAGNYPLRSGDGGQILPVGMAGRVPGSFTGRVRGQKFPHGDSMDTWDPTCQCNVTQNPVASHLLSDPIPRSHNSAATTTNPTSYEAWTRSSACLRPTRRGTPRRSSLDLDGKEPADLPTSLDLVVQQGAGRPPHFSQSGRAAGSRLTSPPLSIWSCSRSRLTSPPPLIWSCISSSRRRGGIGMSTSPWSPRRGAGTR
jgi:hypothetical protein